MWLIGSKHAWLLMMMGYKEQPVLEELVCMCWQGHCKIFSFEAGIIYRKMWVKHLHSYSISPPLSRRLQRRQAFPLITVPCTSFTTSSLHWALNPAPLWRQPTAAGRHRHAPQQPLTIRLGRTFVPWYRLRTSQRSLASPSECSLSYLQHCWGFQYVVHRRFAMW